MDANQLYVTRLYLDLLHRQPDAGGLAAWSGVLDQGQFTQFQVAYDIETSLESRTDQVEALFQLVLGRPADQQALNLSVQFLQGAGTLEQLEAALIGSAEYFSNAGGTNAAFVNAMYQTIVNRAADPGGAAVFNQLLANGVTPTELANDALSSPEAITDRVDNFYTQVLHRSPDPGGLATCFTALASGVRDEVVIAALASSAEYYQDAQSGA